MVIVADINSLLVMTDLLTDRREDPSHYVARFYTLSWE